MTHLAPNARRRGRMMRFVALLWLALSALWASVIIATEALAWPLALWIATTLGPLAVLQRHLDRTETLDTSALEGDIQ